MSGPRDLLRVKSSIILRYWKPHLKVLSLFKANKVKKSSQGGLYVRGWGCGDVSWSVYGWWRGCINGSGTGGPWSHLEEMVSWISIISVPSSEFWNLINPQMCREYLDCINMPVKTLLSKQNIRYMKMNWTIHRLIPSRKSWINESIIFYLEDSSVFTLFCFTIKPANCWAISFNGNHYECW